MPDVVAALEKAPLEVTGLTAATGHFSTQKLVSCLQLWLGPSPQVSAMNSAHEPRPWFQPCTPDRRDGVISRLHRKTAKWDTTHATAGGNLTVYHCRAAFAYILASMRTVVISDCRNCTIVIGAVADMVRMRRCHKVTLVVACRRVVISQADQCALYLYTEMRPLCLDGVQTLTLAPHNTTYPALRAQIATASIGQRPNLWDHLLISPSRGNV